MQQRQEPDVRWCTLKADNGVIRVCESGPFSLTITKIHADAGYAIV